MDYDVKDIALAAGGRLRTEWADQDMPVLAQIRRRFAKERPLAGVRVAACLHVLAPLIYLALKVRENTAAMRMESRRSEFHASNLCILAIIESPEVARIFTTGLSDAGALNAQDFTRFSFLMGQMVGSEAVAFDDCFGRKQATFTRPNSAPT